MPNALITSGAQPDKQTRFAPLYTGRYFSGIWTNRSPLRDAASSRLEEKYYGPRGDAAIAGSNVEVSNRSTIIRRPGNPIYDNVNTYSNVLAFDQFRVNKGLSDVFGSVTEQIYVMVDTTTALHANNATVDQTVFTKSNTGQAYMKQVGNSLYFGDGADNKKWLQSLFVRSSGNNTTAIPTDSYPYMSTFLVDPNNNIQQMIGIWVSNISNVEVDTLDNLTLTISAMNTVGTLPVGTQFVLWNLATATWLNGATITLTTAYTSGGTSLVGTWTGTHAAYNAADTGYVQAGDQFASTGTTLATPKTGASVPTWGTTTPSASNDFMGSVTLDGNVLWVNRGSPTMNWGLDAPTLALTPTASGSEISWAKQTYYSPASVFIDPTHGNLWQVRVAGITGGTMPVWPASPTAATLLEITNVAVSAGVATFTVTNSLGAGQTLVLSHFRGTTAVLNGQIVTVSATGLSGTQFEANVSGLSSYTSVGGANFGVAKIRTGTGSGTLQTDGGVTWECIQLSASLTWTTHTHYVEGSYINKSVGSTPYLFQLQKGIMPSINGTITGFGFNTSNTGQFDKSNPLGAADFTLSNMPSFDMRNYNTVFGNPGGTAKMFGVNGAGEETGTNTDTGKQVLWEVAITGTIYIPTPGTYSFTLFHDDGAFCGIDTSTGAFKVSGTYTNPIGQTKTAKQGYTSLVGTNEPSSSNGNNPWSDNFSWSFPDAGNYGIEIDFAVWHGSVIAMILTSLGVAGAGASHAANIPILPDESLGTTGTVWPAFTTAGASYDTVNQVINWGASVIETVVGSPNFGNIYKWNNLGPISDYTWNANTSYTTPATNIVDQNGNQEGPYETGVSGASAPTFNTSLSAITADNPNLKWINEGPVSSSSTQAGKITATSAQGWLYGIALVNTLDNTVSNIGPVSSGGAGTNGGTGPITNGEVSFAPGAGLNTAVIDTQADYVAIFRTTDGQSTQLLIPNDGNTIYTVPLTQYLQSGYTDTTPDTGLDELAEAAQAGENTPPLPGAVNLTYHLNRIWFSIGNTVYYTTGADAPIGNGTDGVAPANTDIMPSLVKRLVAISIGVLVFTVSDVYIIQTVGSTIYPGVPYLQGVGLSSYNALDVNGSLIGLYTTDSQFILLDPHAGVNYIGFPIGDQLRQNNGSPGTSWSAPNVYVSWYVNGEDQGWFVCDGANGWYRLIQTQAPDINPAWSPFATIVSGVKAIKTVETSPGVHNLLLGPTTSGKIRNRSVTATTDGGTTGSNGTAYNAYIVLGSYVLAHPGQVAEVAFIATDSVNVGSPLILGILIDEALPYYTGSFEMLKNWANDPPGLPPSSSILGQRFYLSEMPDTTAACRHMQVMIQWPAEAAANEMQSFTIFGRFLQEA